MRVRLLAWPVSMATARRNSPRYWRGSLRHPLAGDPCAIVAHDICRGLDLRATAQVHRRLRDYAAAGGAVLLISSDLDEIFALCRRIYVISGGRLREVST